MGEAPLTARHAGKHGTVGEGSSESALRLGQPSRQIGTARYGPVRRVVWDPWLIERYGSVSHGDAIRRTVFKFDEKWTVVTMLLPRVVRTDLDAPNPSPRNKAVIDVVRTVLLPQ